MFRIEALSAEWDVSFITANKLDGLLKDCTEGEVGVWVANFTNGGQFLNFFRLWNQVEDILKACSQEGTIKGRDDDDFSIIWAFLSEFNHL